MADFRDDANGEIDYMKEEYVGYSEGLLEFMLYQKISVKTCVFLLKNMEIDTSLKYDTPLEFDRSKTPEIFQEQEKNETTGGESPRVLKYKTPGDIIYDFNL